MRARTVLFIVVLAAAALAAGKPPADFHFVIFGDRTGGHVDGVYEGIVAEVSRLQPDFAITVGDQIEGYTEDIATLRQEWDEYNNVLKPLPCSIYLTPGNHDITTDGQLPAWQEYVSDSPSYSFDSHGVHFVILDTSRWESSEDWLAQSGYKDWLEKDLAANAKAPLTLVFYHKPFWFDTLAEGKPDGMHEIFKKYGVDAVFNGHFHIAAAATYDAIPYTMVGSSGGGINNEDEAVGAIYQYIWATVKDGKLSWTVLRRGSSLPADYTTAADVKYYNRAGNEYVFPRPFKLGAEGAKAPLQCQVDVINGTDHALTVPLAWKEVANWVITPASAEVKLEAGARGEALFEFTPKGALYPFPTMEAAYPYRDGKTFKFQYGLPACRTQPVAPCAHPPTIDGALDDAWKGAKTATYFCCADGSPCTADPTTFYFMYDKDYLYVAAKCEQEDMSKLVTKAAERDGAVNADDCVGFFFLPAEAGTEFYQIYLNAAGVLLDMRDIAEAPGTVDQDRTWNPDIKAAASKADKYWVAEMAIPMAALAAEEPPAKGTTWRTNFRRKEIYKNEYADWQFPIGFDPRYFGYLVFE